MERISNNRCFEGWQQRFQHESATLGCQMTFSVFLPPQAESSQVPVLYWLSGLTCTDENFVTKAGAQRCASEHGLAIVCPDTSPRGDGVPDDEDEAWDFGLGAGFYLNATQAPWSRHYRMYDYVTNELPELITANLPINSARASISGHSMGGHGALTIALKNPNRFRSVSAFSPIVSPVNCPWGIRAFSQYLGKDQREWLDYDACALLSKATTKVPMMVDQGGADDFLVDQLKTELLIQAADSAEYPINVRYQPGYDHSYFFVSSFIADHIEFHAHHLKL